MGNDMDYEKFDAILDMNDPDFANKLALAIGLKEREQVVFHGPQFERTDGIVPIANPSEVILKLPSMSKEALSKLGMGPWGEYGLWLLPYQWYDFIPEGMELMCIDGSIEPFKKGVTDDDYRFGCLAYGIVPDFEKSA